MLEILNINPINKGSLLASCDVHIVPWKMTMREVKVFEKAGRRWVRLPCREVINAMGEKNYIEVICFDTDAIKTRFTSQVTTAIDEYLLANPDMTPEDVIKEEEIPF